MTYQESGRQHLSPDILRIVDNKGVGYQEMEPGQTLTIHALDAKTRIPSSFILTVASVRIFDERRQTRTATLQYIEGDFNFYDGNNPNNTTRIEPGTLMENGISANLIPQTDYRLSYFGGIGIGRDHSFEFIGGKDSSVIARGISGIDVGTAPADYQPPDLAVHLQRVEETREKQLRDEKRRADDVDRVIMADLEEWFQDHPAYAKMRELIAGYSPNGKLVMSSYLIYGKEDGVLDKAWEVLKQAHKEHFNYEHPAIRGDLDIKVSSRRVFEGMLKDAGIQWPRPKQSDELT